jgi:hypothetical protein
MSKGMTAPFEAHKKGDRRLKIGPKKRQHLLRHTKSETEE